MSTRSLKDRDWVSTLEAARLCGLSHMTIIRRFDAGDLEGYKAPGSRFRRIPKKNLAEFARKHGITLPDTNAPAKTPAPGRRALVVEDDRRMADVMERLLASDGWDVKVARNGFDAGFLASTFLPGLVLLDIMLPGLDGREACRQMRRDPRLAATKILAVTALRDEKSVKEIFAAGVDEYVAKPFELSVLREKIAGLTSDEPQTKDENSVVKKQAGSADVL